LAQTNVATVWQARSGYVAAELQVREVPRRVLEQASRIGTCVVVVVLPLRALTDACVITGNRVDERAVPATAIGVLCALDAVPKASRSGVIERRDAGVRAGHESHRAPPAATVAVAPAILSLEVAAQPANPGRDPGIAEIFRGALPTAALRSVGARLPRR